jgi:hypothetical protein
MQLSDLQKDVLSLLGQYYNSKAAELPDGTGGTATVSAMDTITQYLNEAQDDLAQTVWPLEDDGTYSLPIGSRNFLLSALTTTNGGVIWSAERVAWNGVALTRLGRDYAGIWYATIDTDANSTPLYWGEAFLGAIATYPRPATVEQVAVSGLATPSPLVDPTDTPTWLQASLHKLLAYYAAAKVGAKSTQNDDLAARIQLWQAPYEAGKTELYQRSVKTQPGLMYRLEMAQGGK